MGGSLLLVYTKMCLVMITVGSVYKEAGYNKRCCLVVCAEENHASILRMTTHISSIPAPSLPSPSFT